MWAGRAGAQRTATWVVAAMAAVALVGACSSGDDPAGDGGGVSGADDGGQATGATGPAGTGGADEEGSVRYLSIGDSLTQGVGAPDESTGAFPVLLGERWREDGCEVEVSNVGVSGATVVEMVDQQLPVVEQVSPTIVTFQGGGNDIVNGVAIEDYRTAVETVLDTVVEAGARVVVLPQNEWFRAPAAPDYGDVVFFEEARGDYDGVLVEEAEERGAQVVDLRDQHTADADAERWVEDGIHPTQEVYEEWAAAIAEATGSPCD